MQVTVFAALSTVLLLSLKKYLDFRNALNGIGYVAVVFSARRPCPYSLDSNHPGSRVLFSPMGIIGVLFKKPRKGITKGSMSVWREKYSEFQEHGVDIISSVNSNASFTSLAYLTLHFAEVFVFPRVRASLLVADPAAIKVGRILCHASELH